GPTDKVLGASDGGASPILVAGTRGSFKFVATGFDVRDSDLPLRPAWPLFVLDCINWFADEDAQYLSGFRTGDIWRIAVGSSERATVKLPDRTVQPVAVHEGRAVLLGQRAGFYELSVRGADEMAGGQSISFAANLLDASESAMAPQAKLVVDGKEAGELAGFRLGVKREIWVYLLLAAALLTALEWATYHRRATV
ncbi:MAG TPA: VWA domain-containing protein, partial [Polyangiaceae bacterium]|nr:VWA domain-containing protein [Polyangiaceae bacterium]